MSGTDSSGPPPSNSQQAATAPGKTSNSSESLVHAASEPPDSTSPKIKAAAATSTKMEPMEDAKDALPSETATGAVIEDEVMQDGSVADSAKPAVVAATGKAESAEAESSTTTSDTAQPSRSTNGTAETPNDAATTAPHEQEADAAQHAEGGEPTPTKAASTEERMASETEPPGASEDANRDEQSASASEAATPLGSPPFRDASPALSVASETPSQGAPPVASTSAVAYGESAQAVDLALPFIEYPFANTALVPAGSTEPVPFHYATWPPEPREMSWIRSRRGDDPEQDVAPNTEFGYFATPEEIEASRQKEELRQAKIRAKIQEYEQERTAAYSSFGNGAGRGRGGAKRGRGRAARVRARGRGDSASREGSLDPSYEEAPTASAARRARPAAKSALKAVQPDSTGEKMAVDQPEPKPPRPRVTDATMARMLLPNDLQTALPASIKPHPAEIDPLDLPPYYIASLDVVPGPAPASNIGKHATRSPVKAAQADADAAAGPAVRPSPATEPKPSAAVAPLREEPKPSKVETSQKSATEDKQPKAPKPSKEASKESAKEAAVAKPAKTVAPKSAASAVSAEADKPPPSAVSTTQPASFHGDGKDAASSKRARSPHDEGRKVSKKPALTEGSKEKVKNSSATGKTGEVEIGKDGRPIEYAVQTTTCLSKKMEGQVRCWQCIARGIGHGCSFAGVRWFGYNRNGRVVAGPVFRSITDEEDDDPDWDKAYTMPMSDVHSNLLKTWVADALLDVLKKEVKCAKAHNPIRVRHDLALQAVCDTCYEVCVITEFMCKVCGRTACPVCYARLEELDKNPTDEGFPAGLVNLDAQRRRKCVAKKRGRESTGAAGHTAANFVALTKYDSAGIEKVLASVQSWWDQHELAPVDTKVQDYLRKKFVLPSNLKEYDENTWPVWTFQHRVLDDALFFEVWRNHEPIVVRRCPPLDLAKFTPQYFAQHFGNVPVELVHSRTLETKTSNLGYFFGEFQCDYKRRGGQPELSRKQTWRPKKGFPSQWQWESDFKELHAAFLSWLPLPNIFHPNGVLNILAHTPENAAPPDLTPQLFTSWETDAATPTIQLQTHDYDLLSHMVWGGSDHRTGKLLRIRWDVWRKEDGPKIRDFCLEVLQSSHPRGTTMSRVRQLRDDPLLNPAVYLTKRQRATLYERTGIKPYPLYQYMGDTVLIPAGCPYQVSSWIDHINLNIPFLAGSSCSRALQVHKDSRPETKERSLWREDKVQLEVQLLYTYLSCEEYDHFGVGTRKMRGKLNWPFPRDEKNRPVVPPEELARLQELTDAETRGTEISNEVKKAGTAAYDEAWNAGIAEAECKKRAEKARDDKALELRRKREIELGLPPQPGGLTPAAAAALLPPPPKPPKPPRPIIDGRS